MKKAVLIIVPILVLSVFSGCGTKQIAEVHGLPITQNDLNKAKSSLKKILTNINDSELNKIALDNLKAQKAVEYEAKKEGITVSEKELNDAWNKVQDKSQITKENLRDILLSNKLFEKYTKDITVSPDEVNAYYDKNKDLYTTVKVYEISVKDKDTAQMIYEELKQGTDFNSLFNKYSIDKTSGNGGYMGDIPVKEKIFNVSLKPDTIYEPIAVNNDGYIILKTGEQTVKPFDEVKDGIQLSLLNQKKIDFYKNKITEWEGSSK